MSRYLLQHGTRTTPQSQPIPGSAQVPNSAGGYAWAVDDWTRLDRFLVLGSEGGTYYVGERELTAQNSTTALRCILSDGLRVVRRVVEISEAGRAPKNDAALYVLAMASAKGDDASRKAALDALPKVARIGTHLFHFLAFRESFGGWGRGMRSAVARWYTDRDADSLAYQVVKYRQRDGWSHRDALRLAHPKADGDLGVVLRFAADKLPADEASGVRLVEGFRLAQASPSPKATASLVREFGLPREGLLTEHLNAPEVWDALLDDMPMTALVRNLATMTRVGVIAPMSAGSGKALAILGNPEKIAKSRIHPIAVLSALLTYQSGRGVRGQNTWAPVAQIVDALDAAFYTAFGNVEPANKRTMLALDVSGSMASGEVAGVPGLTPRVGSVAMALVTAATESQHMFTGFTNGAYRSQHSAYGYNSGLSVLSISPRQRLDDACRAVDRLPFGGTDCALPMVEALKHGWEIDTFVVYTDSETWAGNIHPSQALQQYREKTGIAAKLVVVGMVANGFTIADPNDGGMLDVVGFDSATPNIINDFSRGL